MTKYEPSHEWVKEAKLKGALAQVADSATDHLGRVIDNSKPDDWAFFITWLSLATLLYSSGTIKNIMKAINVMQDPNTLYTQIMGTGSLATWGLNIGNYIVNALRSQAETDPIELTEQTLAEVAYSLVFSYVALKGIANITTITNLVKGIV